MGVGFDERRVRDTLAFSATAGATGGALIGLGVAVAVTGRGCAFGSGSSCSMGDLAVYATGIFPGGYVGAVLMAWIGLSVTRSGLAASTVRTLAVVLPLVGAVFVLTGVGILLLPFAPGTAAVAARAVALRRSARSPTGARS